MQLAFGTGKLSGFSVETIEILLLLPSKTESKIWDLSAATLGLWCGLLGQPVCKCKNPKNWTFHCVSVQIVLSVNKQKEYWQ